MTTSQWSFSEFAAANNGSVSGLDYVHAVYRTHRLHGDFLVQMAELLCPNFLEIDGLAFLSAQFRDEDYEKLLTDGHSRSGAQFWLNLLEISGIFDETDIATCLVLARTCCDCWNLKLRSQFLEKGQEARVIHDTEADEVFVVVGFPDPIQRDHPLAS